MTNNYGTLIQLFYLNFINVENFVDKTCFNN